MRTREATSWDFHWQTPPSPPPRVPWILQLDKNFSVALCTNTETTLQTLGGSVSKNAKQAEKKAFWVGRFWGGPEFFQRFTVFNGGGNEKNSTNWVASRPDTPGTLENSPCRFWICCSPAPPPLRYCKSSIKGLVGAKKIKYK